MEVIGLTLMVGGIVTFGVGFRFCGECRPRWWLNWWTIALVYVGTTTYLSALLLDK